MGRRLSAIASVDMEAVTKSPQEWRVDRSLLETLAPWKGGNDVGTAPVGFVALLHSLATEGGVEPGTVMIVTDEEVLESPEYERRVEDPLLDAGYDTNYVTIDDGDEGILVKKTFRRVADVEDGEVVLVDVSRNTLTTMAIAMGAASAVHWKSAKGYLVEGDLLEGVKTWTRSLVVGEEDRSRGVYRDRTHIVSEFETVSAVTMFLMSLIPPFTDVGLRERAVTRLRRVALSEKVPIPGPFRRDVREGIPSPVDDDVHEMVNEYVFEPLREAVLGKSKKSVVPVPSDVTGAVRTVRSLRNALRNVVLFKLRRGRMADAAALMNEVHGFIKMSAAVVHAAIKSNNDDEVHKLSELFRLLSLEQYGRFEDPYDRIKEARIEIRRVLSDLGINAEKNRNEGDPINYDLLTNKIKDKFNISGVPLKSSFKRAIREAYDKLIASFDDDMVNIAKEWFKSDRFSYLINDPPIRKIRNRLMHADPVDPRMRKDDVLVTFKKIKLHLDVITVPALEALAGEAERVFIGGSDRR